jgi:pathogenesis-related protein 1
VNRRVACLVFALLLACGGAARETRDEPVVSTDEPTIAAPPASSADPSDPAMSAIVDAHAARRLAHCAAPLEWSASLARTAQAWADHLASSGCQLEHSQNAYGENLAAGTAGTLSPADVVDMWYAEGSQYRYPNGGFSMDTGHFTQLVWRGSESLGCGVSHCGGLDVWVCNYDPPGNVEGEYRTNVLPTSCR